MSVETDRERLQRREDLADVLQTVNGRRFVWRILCLCGADEAPCIAPHEVMCFTEGKRNVAATLLSDIRKLPDGLELEAQMRKEARSQVEEEDDEAEDEFLE